MRKFLILLFVIFSLNLFAGIYKVYFINGGVIVLKEKPDFSPKRIIGVMPDGKKIVFLKKLVDFKRTEEANKPEPKSKKIVKQKKKIKVIPSVKHSSKPPLIITEATVGKKEKKGKKTKDKKETNPWTSWKNEGAKDSNLSEGDASDSGEMNEEDAKKYWRSQFIRVNNSITNTKDEINVIQEELNRLTSQKLNTDDNIMIMKINGQISKLEKQKKVLESKLKKYKKQKEDLKDKARRAGALPGWYRDLI